MKNTLIVNLFAGPGTGKSTAAAYIFSRLKMKGIEAEIVTEYAKDKTWEANNEAFKCQLYINAKQAYRISRVYGKVDVIITDSPILLGAVYCAGTEYIRQASIGEDAKYTNRYDILLKRDPQYKYNPNGRNQDENGALELDKQIKNIIEERNLPYDTFVSHEDSYNKIVEEILKRIKEN